MHKKMSDKHVLECQSPCNVILGFEFILQTSLVPGLSQTRGKVSLVTTACACANPYQENMAIEIRLYIVRVGACTCSGYQALLSPLSESLGTRRS